MQEFDSSWAFGCWFLVLTKSRSRFAGDVSQVADRDRTVPDKPQLYTVGIPHGHRAAAHVAGMTLAKGPHFDGLGPVGVRRELDRVNAMGVPIRHQVAGVAAPHIATTPAVSLPILLVVEPELPGFGMMGRWSAIDIPVHADRDGLDGQLRVTQRPVATGWVRLERLGPRCLMNTEVNHRPRCPPHRVAGQRWTSRKSRRREDLYQAGNRRLRPGVP